jgi:tetratricopeptide (TPR) repeat protein
MEHGHAASQRSDQPSGHDTQVPQQVMIQARLLLERTAFVGHGFNDADLDVVEFFKSLLSELSVKIITGERPEAGSVSQKVKERISQAELFVGILTRKEKVDENHWTTSDWVIDERTHAAALGKKVILLKEKGIELKGGIHGDSEYIEFDREQLHRAAIKLIQMVAITNGGKFTFQKNGPFHLNVDFLEAAVSAQPNEPMLRVHLAQSRASNGQVDRALRELAETLRLFPNYLPARLELVKGLRTIGKNEEARKELQLILDAQPFDAGALHQLGHILEEKNDASGARDAFMRAETVAPGDASHFLCHAKLLFRTANNNRDRLIEARDLLAIAFDLGGPNFEKREKGLQSGIERRIKQLPPKRTTEAKSKKRKH